MQAFPLTSTDCLRLQANGLLLGLGLCLLVQIELNTSLSCLSLIMLGSIHLLRCAISGQACHCSAKCALSPVTNPFSKIRELSPRLLALAGKVLFSTCLLQVLVAEEASYGFFGAADCLVPTTLRSVSVVLRWSTR